MSTVQSYQYSDNPQESARRQLIALESRRLESVRLQAQQNINQLNSQLTTITQEMNRLAIMDLQSVRNNEALNSLTNQLNTTQAQLSEARHNLAQQIESVKKLYAEADCEKDLLNNAIRQAQSSLSEINRISQMSFENIDDMADAIKQGTDLAVRQTEIENQIHEVETELRFLTSHAEMQPAALITLEAMRENGYRLKEAKTAEELTFYFEQKERAHQIAVRIAKPVRKGENIHSWDMIAETFQMNGESCLMEIEDFETSVEIMDIGELKRGQFRVYPKDPRSRAREKCGIIPSLYESNRDRKRQVKHKKTVVQ